MFFLKEHLLSRHYHWLNDAGTSRYMGEPGRRLFDPFNGNQVLYIINFFGKSLGKLTMTDGQKLEELIIRQLPHDIRSELAVFNWLRGVYLYHSN
jgi:hypothetical protein